MAEQIPIFTAPEQDVPHPDNAAYEANIMAGRRESQMAGQIGKDIQEGVSRFGEGVVGGWQNLDELQAHKELAAAYPQLGEMEGTRGAAIENILKNNPDMDAGAQLHALQQLREADYDKIAAGVTSISGKEAIQKEIALRKEQDVVAYHGESIRATANAIITSMDKSADMLANNAYNDPHSALQAIDNFARTQRDIVSRTPGMTEEVRDRIEEKLTADQDRARQQAVSGIINKYGAAAGRAAIASGQYALKDPEALGRQADEKERAARIDENLDYERREHALNISTENVGAMLMKNSYIDPQSGRFVMHPNAMQAVVEASQQPPGSPGFMRPSVAFEILSHAEQGITQQNAATRQATEDQQKGNYANLEARFLLPKDDPNYPKVTDIVNAGLAQQISGEQVAKLSEKIKNPYTVEEQARINATMADLTKAPPFDTGSDPQGMANARAYIMQAIDANRAAGISPTRTLNPNDPNYWAKNFEGNQANPFAGFATPATSAKSKIDAGPVNQQQQSLSSTAMTVAKAIDLYRTQGPEATNALINATRPEGQKIDVRNGNWCAELLNSALPPELRTGQDTAVSFRNWGNAVAPQEARQGDVFYTGLSGGGDTGHVGVVVGNQPRVGPNGQMQLLVASSHMQGDSGNPPGVEWRNAGSLMIRRAQASVGQAAENPTSSWWPFTKSSGGGFHGVITPPPAPAPQPANTPYMGEKEE
jgi:hypothetical protein